MTQRAMNFLLRVRNGRALLSPGRRPGKGLARRAGHRAPCAVRMPYPLRLLSPICLYQRFAKRLGPTNGSIPDGRGKAGRENTKGPGSSTDW